MLVQTGAPSLDRKAFDNPSLEKRSSFKHLSLVHKFDVLFFYFKIVCPLLTKKPRLNTFSLFSSLARLSFAPNYSRAWKSQLLGQNELTDLPKLQQSMISTSSPRGCKLGGKALRKSKRDAKCHAKPTYQRLTETAATIKDGGSFVDDWIL